MNELLDISSGDTFTSLGNAILDDIPEVDILFFSSSDTFTSLGSGMASRWMHILFFQ